MLRYYIVHFINPPHPFVPSVMIVSVMNVAKSLVYNILNITRGSRTHNLRGTVLMVLALATWQGLFAQVTLPYATGFEADDGYVAGEPLGGDWATTDASTVTVTAEGVPYTGLQSVLMLGASLEPIMSLDFESSGSSVLFADFYLRLTASPLPVLPIFNEPETTAVIALQLQEQGFGEWVFLDGDKGGSGTWLSAGLTAPLDEAGLTAAWHRVTLRLNLATDAWDVYVDEVPLAVDLGFVERLWVGSEAINIHGSSAGVTYVDNFMLTATNPLFTDTDLDGMEDGFEADHGLNTEVDDRALDPDADGLSNIEEFLYGTDPQVSDIAVIELSADGDNQTVVDVVNDWLVILQNGTSVFEKPLDEVFGLAISGVGSSNIGDITFASALTVTGNLSIKNAKNVTFNAPLEVTGTTLLEASENIAVNAELRCQGDVVVSTGLDFIFTQGSIHVSGGGFGLPDQSRPIVVGRDFIVRANSHVIVVGGNALVSATGGILVDDGSSFKVDNTSAAFGNMLLTSGKTITISNNSLVHSSNNYLSLSALEYISLVDNSVLSSVKEGFVSIQVNSGDLTIADSQLSLDNNDLFLYVQGVLRIIRGSIDLNTGVAQFIAFVDATVEENSSLTVTDGDIYGQINRDLTVSDNSRVAVDKGNIGLNVIGNTLIERDSRLEVFNLETFGDNGGSEANKLQLIVSGATTFESGSAIALENTELVAFSFDRIDFLNSAITVFTGADSLVDTDASIRTNASLSLTESTLSMDGSNLFVNAAKSMHITGSNVTATDGNFYLNTRVNTIIDAGSTLSVIDGDLYANIFGEAILRGMVQIDNVFSAYVQGDFTLAKTTLEDGSEIGSLDALTILLSSGRNIAIDGRMDTSEGNGRVFMNAQGSIYMKSLDPITASELFAASVTGIFLRTDVDTLTAQTTGVGLGSDFSLGNYTGSAEIEIQEVDKVVLQTMYNADGPIRVMAGGTIRAVQVLSATDAPGHNVGLMSTGGDLEVGSVSSGVTHGQVSLSASGTIRELAPFDAADDVSGSMAVIFAGTEIATGEPALEMAITGDEVYSFANENVIFNRANDVEIFLSTGDHAIDIVATQGDVVVTYAESGVANGIDIKSINGDIYLGYVNSAFVAGNEIFAGDLDHLVPDGYGLRFTREENLNNLVRLFVEAVPLYTVTFNLGEKGSLLHGELIQSVLEGGTAIAPELSVADGYAFAGWDRSLNGINGDVIIRAYYADKDLVSIENVNKELASDGQADHFLGTSVSVHGDTAVIGTYTENAVATAESACAYVYERVNGVWAEQAKLTVSDEAPNGFVGYKVSIYGDTIVIGAYTNVNGSTNLGSAYVFERINGVWKEQAKLTASDRTGNNDYFGYSVSISGSTIVVGAYTAQVNLTKVGSAYVYERINGVWTEQKKLRASDGAANDFFGHSVSISGDTIMVGAHGAKVNGAGDAGSVYVYERVNGSWTETEQAKLTAPVVATFDFFGRSLSLSGDLLAVGAEDANAIGASFHGAVYVYERISGGWTFQKKLTATDRVIDDWFGQTLSVSGDTIVAGASAADANEISNSGSVYVYERINGAWNDGTKLAAFDGAAETFFGYSVSISGNTLVAGCPATYNDETNGYGSAYFYNLSYAANHPPAIHSSPVTSVVLGSEYLYEIDAVDFDPDDTVTLGATTLPAWLSLENGFLSGVPDYSHLGDHLVEIVATDLAGDTVSQSFTITVEMVDSDNDAMSDSWERLIIDFDPNDTISGIEDVLPGDDFDGDGLSNLEEFIGGSGPSDYYNGQREQYTVNILNTTTPRGAVGSLAIPGLTVEVRDATGALAVNAPISLSPQAPSAQLTLDPGGSALTHKLTAYTNEQGQATIYIQP